MGAPELSREKRSDLTFQLLTGFSSTALGGLVDIAGSQRAIELNKPYWHHSGKAAALIAMQSSPSLVTKDLRGWILMNRLVDAMLRRSRGSWPSRYSLAKQGVFVHCPFENGPPEFCYLFDYVAANGALESFDLDFELLLEATMAEGAPVCVFSKIKRFPGNDEVDNIELETPSPLDIPKEVLDSLTMQYLGEHWVMIARAIGDYEGREEVLDRVKKRLRELGQARAGELMKVLGLTERSLATISAVLGLLNSLLFQEGEVTGTASGEEKRISLCPFQDAPGDMCAQFEAFTNGIIDEIDPQYELVHPEAMCRGSDHCVRSIRERSSTGQEP